MPATTAATATTTTSPWANPLAPLPASEQPKHDIAAERAKASFDPSSLTTLIDGGVGRTARRRFLRSLVLADPIFSNADSIFQTHTERYKRALAKCARLDQLIGEYALGEEDAAILRACSAEDLPTLLHDLCVGLSVWVSVCLSVGLSVCRSVGLSVRLSGLLHMGATKGLSSLLGGCLEPSGWMGTCWM
jgi:hypothetical protein